MDDDTIIDRLIAAVGLVPFTSLVNTMYLAGYMRGVGYRAPTPTSSRLQSLLSHADRALWQSIEVAYAQALAEESERPPPEWLAEVQRQRPPPDEDEEGERGIGL